ncbi:M48 family metallopeptidase [Thermogemmatispora sp.]|uniref:M48 metallopeptidase family protein n=1 Tax=Thermogemmatispora sp. TaxID=1968838 RepID=UPI001D3FDD98|nr:M48 family metallopeptidase [Thermogemmatispora sp.]MBX5450400.1 M48 family metallopeptidase [Thermogemmatispora sp.]
MKAPKKKSKRQSPEEPQYWYDDEELRWAVRYWAARIGVKVPQVRFQRMPDAWGRITPNGWLALDPTLLTLPRPLGELVIVHELVHQLVPNHGRVFKLFMHAYLPDWEERERELQRYAQSPDEHRPAL